MEQNSGGWYVEGIVNISDGYYFLRGVIASFRSSITVVEHRLAVNPAILLYRSSAVHRCAVCIVSNMVSTFSGVSI